MSNTSVRYGSYITAKFRDGGSGLDIIGWAWDNEAYQQESVNGTTSTYSKNIYVPNTNGKHTLHLNAKDRNGNISGWKDYTITVSGANSNYNGNNYYGNNYNGNNYNGNTGYYGDTTAPSISMNTSSAASGSYITANFRDSSSGLNIIGWTWDNEPYQQENVGGTTSTYYKNIYVPNTNGTHTLYLNAIDMNGNVTGWKKYTIRVTGGIVGGDYTAPTITMSNKTINLGGYVSPKFKDSNSGLKLIGWAWDNQPYEQDYVDGTTSSYTYKLYAPETRGTHTLFLNAQDEEGNISGWKKYTITVR